MIGAALSSNSQAYLVAYSAFPTPASIYVKTENTGSITSPLVKANVTGALGELTYLWERISGDEMTINSIGGEQTSFTAKGYTHDVKNSVMRCTISDAGNGGTQTSFNVNVSFIFESNK